MLEQAIQLGLSEWLFDFVNPRKRIFWGYLATALAISILWLTIFRHQSLKQSLNTIFNKKSWFSRTAFADYLVWFINSFIMILLSPHLLAKSTVAYLVFEGLHSLFNGRTYLPVSLPDWSVALLFTLFLFLLDDFARYWLHRWLHTVSWLWPFHKVHHSATALNPITVFRTHPVEAVLFSIRGALVQGATASLFFFLFGNQVSLIMVVGASVFVFIFNVLGSNLRHSPVSIGYWRPLEIVFMSPAQHQIHHSCAIEHWDKNLGVALSLWDKLFGTLVHSKKDQQLTYGLHSQQSDREHSLISLYLQPLFEIKGLIRRQIIAVAKSIATSRAFQPFR